MSNINENPMYEIRVKGHFDQRWSLWFEGLVIHQDENGETELRGQMDQSAVHGYLARIRDLGLELKSVQVVENGS